MALGIECLFSFFWVFELFWRLVGTSWAQDSDLCDFGDPTPLKKESLFGLFFHTFCINFLMFFWVPVFLDSLWSWVPKASQMGTIWRSFWGHFWWPAISWFLLPLLYETLIFEVWRAPKLHNFWWLFWGCSQAGLWNTIFQDFEWFWAPNGRPFGSQMASKNETKKRAPKRGSRQAQVTGCGPLKNKQNRQWDHQKNTSNTPWRAWRHGGGYK